jgi:hypothetical protein
MPHGASPLCFNRPSMYILQALCTNCGSCRAECASRHHVRSARSGLPRWSSTTVLRSGDLLGHQRPRGPHGRQLQPSTLEQLSGVTLDCHVGLLPAVVLHLRHHELFLASSSSADTVNSYSVPNGLFTATTRITHTTHAQASVLCTFNILLLILSLH